MENAAHAGTVRIAAFGDSLTAGWGLKPDESFAAVLQRELRARGYDVEVINFGISGDTTAGGVARMRAVMAVKPDGVILELGANDGLRGFDPALVEANLDQILTMFGQARIPVLLAGMRTLSGMGKRYGEEFAQVYPRLAQKHGVRLYPFFLEGVAGDPALNLPDGLHPTGRGIEEIVKRILPDVEAFMKQLSSRK
ncbi:MAG: arylesterase [Desulfovibrio sp.]|nr:arylesterase [Desulfovibrio sp.]MBI4958687.1 arylesterase [Desulfovibrio sp.]